MIAKQGEYGSGMITRDGFFALPAYPPAVGRRPHRRRRHVRGRLVGYVAAHAGEDDVGDLRRAMAYGTALASFNVEEFGTERALELGRDEIAERVAELERITRFVDAPASSARGLPTDGEDGGLSGPGSSAGRRGAAPARSRRRPPRPG